MDAYTKRVYMYLHQLNWQTLKIQRSIRGTRKTKDDDHTVAYTETNKHEICENG